MPFHIIYLSYDFRSAIIRQAERREDPIGHGLLNQKYFYYSDSSSREISEESAMSNFATCVAQGSYRVPPNASFKSLTAVEGYLTEEASAFDFPDYLRIIQDPELSEETRQEGSGELKEELAVLSSEQRERFFNRVPGLEKFYYRCLEMMW